jgi:hypothetical protein
LPASGANGFPDLPARIGPSSGTDPIQRTHHPRKYITECPGLFRFPCPLRYQGVPEGCQVHRGGGRASGGRWGGRFRIVGTYQQLDRIGDGNHLPGHAPDPAIGTDPTRYHSQQSIRI